jgi:translation initiation factor 2 subunit 1
MVKKQKLYPEAGELVVAQVESIERMYIYVRLEDYEGKKTDSDQVTPGVMKLKGMVHISELANRWIRNISSLVRINQRLVLKVLKMDEAKGNVDLSLRRVTTEQMVSKLNDWKYELKAENLFKHYGEIHKMTLDEVYQKIGWPLIEQYKEIHVAFDAIKDGGIAILKDLNISDELKKSFTEMIDTSVQLHQVDIEGQFEFVVYEGNGMNIIKDAFTSARNLKSDKNVTIEFLYIGAPHYRLKISANDYPTAEKNLKKILETIESKIKSVNGHMQFQRTD